MWEQMRLIVRGSTVVDGVDKHSAMLERNTLEELGRLPSPRILSHHLRFQQLPSEVKEKRTKLVLLYRNPKDVAVSFYHFHKHGPWWGGYSGQFCNWISLFYEGKGRCFFMGFF